MIKSQVEHDFKRELKIGFAQRLDYYARLRGLKQIDIAKRLNVSKATVSTWFSPSNSTLPESETIKKLADLLGVSMELLLKGNQTEQVRAEIGELMNYSIPVFESVSAGFRAYTPSEIIDYAILPFKTKSEADETLCIRVSGDSMSPKIEDGDLIQVHKQTSVDSGDIAVVLLDGDNGLVKKVEYTADSITLISLNLNYPPIVLKGREILRVSVVGKVKKVIREL